ncbi:uncharacterized protein LOC125057748 [Pieris napi]|uniref:uncharacterized protein LOC125057748 n=1 Tax=Pieris napi TaxID=78633 RepID=UPI001FB8DF13|nr:uncharacterized protein LOC125057748 [Pieris napi]
MNKNIVSLCATLLWIYSVASQSGNPVKIPPTRFTCQGRPSGYYADVETDCQIYHMCDGLGRQFSYSCPNTTLFQQRMLVCDHWYMVNCSNSENDYDANLLIGQRDKPFVSEEEMRQRTPRPDILSVPPNTNYYDGLRESESKFSIHPGNSIVGIADSISNTNNNGLDSDKQNYRPPSSWSTGIGQRSTTPRSINKKQYNANNDLNTDFTSNVFGNKQNNGDNIFQSTVQTPVTETTLSPPSQDLSLPFLPKSNDGANQLDIRMTDKDPVYNFINRFDPNSPDTNLATPMTKSQILDINKQLPSGQASSEEDRSSRGNKNYGNKFNVVRDEKKKGEQDQSRIDTINSKLHTDKSVATNSVPEPNRNLVPPKLEFPAQSLTTTMGPPIYYQWKWAVPAFDLEPPKVGNFTLTGTSKKSPGKRPFSSVRSTTEAADPTPSSYNTEYNISSYFVPDYVFPLDGPHPGYGDEDAQTSFQVEVSRPGRSSYGENTDCPQCHPAYLNPGTCEPCIVKR